MPYCSTNGINLFYQDQGKGAPLLFLHGLGSSSEDWKMQIEAFAKDYRVIAIDVRGHGRSDKPEGPYNIPLYASDIRNLLDTLAIERFHLVGFSMGGMISFQLAVNMPARIKSLIIVNSAPAVPYNTLKEKLEIFLRLATIHTLGMNMLAKLIGKRLFPESQQKVLYQQFIERMKYNPKHTYIQVLKSILGWDVRPELSDLQMPVLIISADNDYTPVSYKQEYQQLISNSSLVVIEDSRHATPNDQPEKLNQEVFHFLSSLV
jgi:3-oxoadipate enol-lactonase